MTKTRRVGVYPPLSILTYCAAFVLACAAFLRLTLCRVGIGSNLTCPLCI